MKIILCEDIPKLGVAGQIKNVSDGYARNLLLPRKLALLCTPGNVKKWESEKKVRELRLQKDRDTAQSLASQLENVVLEIRVQSGREGHLFGAVTTVMIKEALLKKGFSVDKKNILLETPIKALGEYPVLIRLHPQITATIKVMVSSNQPTATTSK
jgi:large subunit ribosomal protein L9